MKILKIINKTLALLGVCATQLFICTTQLLFLFPSSKTHLPALLTILQFLIAIHLLKQLHTEIIQTWKLKKQKS